MKKYILGLAFLTVFFSVQVLAQTSGSSSSMPASAEERFEKGNQHYTAGEYGEAIRAYESVLALGYTSSKLYFNLGNAYYKGQNIPKALLYFERAKLIDPNDNDINFNIALCNQFVVDKIDPLPQPFFVEWYHALVNVNSADKWAKMSLVCFGFTILLALTFFLIGLPLWKKLSFGVGILALVLTLMSFVFAAQQKSKATHHTTAIVFSPTVTVKASPDDSGTALFVIHQGLKVNILESLGSWYRIKLADGNVGWVKKEILEKI